MKTRGISFNTQMVEAIISGTKTQTRRMSAKAPAAVGDMIYVREACFIAAAGTWDGPHTLNPDKNGEACYFKRV